ncbi:uncharacterized protein PHACADRAFT_82137 [Phanerochaete carnosa HHB-10118-sp]|uniref:F-box domain-containing protein n=1 Tax=Phanerochaete carnosa (strain HHB-10118-sp) TaxID=650164 RepID=K5XBK1_PHACS|nr:uncharacterized protein PHACADRAFT_82137 [Phanerochaete carnosa HHB-10118-sp]EKM60322.1 hypothetical protein PHACADRAFT_82137 [Phanerochaete carnosa HHB-10118-sp]
MPTSFSALRKHWKRGEQRSPHVQHDVAETLDSSALTRRNCSGVRDAPDYNIIFGSLRAKIIAQDVRPSRFRIQDLPPELLAEVFFRYILLIFHTCSSIENPPRPYAWLVIRHVCGAWRAVALAYPQLSSHIYPSRKLACVQDMLSRSGTVPLYVHDILNDWMEFNMEVRREVLDHLDRIVSVRIAVHLSVPTPSPRGSQHPAVSILETMSIHARPYIGLTCRLFPGWVFPRLQDFTCWKISLSSFHTLLPPGLRRLSLNHCFPSLLLDDLISLLDGLPQLEALVVRNAFTVSDLSGGTQRMLSFRKSVALRRLRTLDLWDHCYVRASHFLRRLAYPGTASIRLSFVGAFENPPYDSELLVDPLLARFDTMNCDPFIHCSSPQSLLIVSTIDQWLRVCLWTERLSLEELQEKKDRGDCACFCFNMATPPITFLRVFLRRLPLADIRFAHLAEPGVTGAFPWRELFPSLTSLEGLTIQCAEWPSLEREIWQRAEDFERGSPHSLFPALTVAQLCNLYKPMWHVEMANTSYISDLHILVHLLRGGRTCERGSVFAQGKPIKIWTPQDFRPNRKTYLDDDLSATSRDRHPEVISYQPGEEPPAVSCVAPFTSWFSSRGASLRRSLRTGS